MYVLGINAAFHDSSASLLVDGEVVAAAEEERFTRAKHHKRATPYQAHALPFHAIDYCLAAAGIELKDVDRVAYSLNPFLLTDGAPRTPRFELPTNAEAARKGPGYDPWESIFLAGVTAAPRMLLDDVPWHLKGRFAGDRSAHHWQFDFVEHHIAHAASAYYPSPFDSAAILTLDGRGELTSTMLAVGKGNQIRVLQQVRLPSSLGLLYEQVTEHLGFLRSSDEYKVMALASYGKPRYVDRIRSLIEWCGDGRYAIRQVDLTELVGPARAPKSAFEEEHFDVASSLQLALGEAGLRLADWLHEQTGEENLCLAGGVALNCVMNARIERESKFKRVWVQPSAGDAGTSLGAAEWVWARHGGSDARRWRMDHAYLGPEYDDGTIEEALRFAKATYRRCEDIADAAAEYLVRGAVLGWFQGRMEFGPRALGARSILASPADPGMVQRLNQLKDREDFRPVAPAVLREAAPEYFEGCDHDAPFMLFVYPVREDKADLVPATRHVDGTARVQTVTEATSPRYYRLISRFRDRTGLPVLVNTSFNVRTQPIVCTPRDALDAFFTSPIDVLAIGSFLVTKQG